MDKVLENRICLLIKEMTLEEKTGMIHGAGLFYFRICHLSHRGGGKNSYSPFKDVRWTDGCAQRVCQ